MPNVDQRKQQKSLGASLYDATYYEKLLPGLEAAEDPNRIDEAAPDCIEIGSIKAGENILDFGCGRGTCAVALAKWGCRVTGADFSTDAINYAKRFAKRFPEALQQKITWKQMHPEDLDETSMFDVIVFNQVYEHLHGWELERLLGRLKKALKPGGRLVISTPNLYYERYLFPLKRITNLPFKIVKECLRLVRGKSRHADSLSKFFKEIFKIRYPESEHTKLHINLQTPASIGKFLRSRGFDASVTVIDRHKNPLSLLTRKCWGKTIWVCAKPVPLPYGKNKV